MRILNRRGGLTRRAIKEYAGELQQTLLLERLAHNDAIRIGNQVRDRLACSESENAQLRAQVTVLRNAARTADTQMRVEHSGRTDVVDQAAWIASAIASVNEYIDQDDGIAKLGAALHTIGDQARKLVPAGRVLPHVPLSSLAGGEDEVKRANQAAGPLAHLTTRMLPRDHVDVGDLVAEEDAAKPDPVQVSKASVGIVPETPTARQQAQIEQRSR